ncbi:uncharacterized protein MONOS_13201 [Monocercomonoides exilis]|uniref:uncharacterized protein n=1 Tax=Monocercomonoides exilis TaxID=2049356 RepID=UPI00355A37F2|nr:hypothetical protein MONOS_13201 [Monocercomonoides exilis]|eukprot:MONOS_13201.1-p1 / transcript=MONOS_13201.1 / gene=MONOS_13201 / organism=Monocercomonoides_exilis_PA203 / gene_product=unspecified product / transcript_product=unspecified product / location=Mono_scaffold00790:1452-4262(-) / protein_length=936 / sequence_SO=supercontig / SO=protein_coding / is_pseudo=false
MAYASDGDKLYIFGGISASGFLNDLWEFDTQNNQWKELKIVTGGVGPEPCSGAGMLVANGYAVVYGGDTGGDDDFSLDMFRIKIDTISSQSWEEVKITDKDGNASSIPNSRSQFGHATFISSDGAFAYIHGGRQSNNLFDYQNSLLILDCCQVVKEGNDIKTAKYKEITFNFPKLLCLCGCTTDSDGNLFIFGGKTKDSITGDLYVVMKEDLSLRISEEEIKSEPAKERRQKFRKKIISEEYIDTKSGQLSKHSKSENNSRLIYHDSNSPFIRLISVNELGPSPRVNPTVGSFSDGFFVYGGRDPETGKIFNDLYSWTFLESDWVKRNPIEGSETPPARELASCCIERSRLLFFGGLGINPQTGTVEPSNELWEFSLETHSWKQLGKKSVKKPTAVYGASSVTYMDHLIISGGIDRSGKISSSYYMFNFGTDSWMDAFYIQPLFKNSLLVTNMITSKKNSESEQQKFASNKKKYTFTPNSTDGFKSTKWDLMSTDNKQVENASQKMSNDDETTHANLIVIGGMDGISPIKGFICYDLVESLKSKISQQTNCSMNDEDMNHIFHYQDGMALPFENKVLMFGGRNGDRAMDTFKVVEFDKYGHATVSEDDGTELKNGIHLDVVEAGCTIFQKDIICFGGRKIRNGGIVMPTALDTFRNISIRKDVLGCSPGYFQNNEYDCELCPPGYYSNYHGSKVCLPCPAGTNGELKGVQEFDCKFVEAGKFTNTSGLTEPMNCSEKQFCPIGSASNNNTMPTADPSRTTQPQSFQEPSKAVAVINIISYVALAAIGFVAALFLLCFRTKSCMWKLDGYSSKYSDSLDPHTHSSVKQIRKTTFGGFVSIVAIFFVAGVVLSNILGFFLFNITETRTTVDASTESHILEHFTNNHVLIELTLMDYTGECVGPVNKEINEKSGRCSDKLGLGKLSFDPDGMCLFFIVN